MKIAVVEAESRLTELVRRAAAGEEVILTVQGSPDIRLTPVKKHMDKDARLAFLRSIIEDSAETPSPGPSAARSQDFLYGEDGLPA